MFLHAHAQPTDAHCYRSAFVHEPCADLWGAGNRLSPEISKIFINFYLLANVVIGIKI